MYHKAYQLRYIYICRLYLFCVQFKWYNVWLWTNHAPFHMEYFTFLCVCFPWPKISKKKTPNQLIRICTFRILCTVDWRLSVDMIFFFRSWLLILHIKSWAYIQMSHAWNCFITNQCNYLKSHSSSDLTHLTLTYFLH